MKKKGIALLSLLGLAIVGAALAPAVTYASFVSSKDINKDVYVKRTIYLNATNIWSETNTSQNRFAVWTWKVGADGSWANSESFMDHYDGLVYRAVLPSDAQYVTFVKLTYGEKIVFPDWRDKVSQTADLALDDDWDTFTITSKGSESVNAEGTTSSNHNGD